jgi:hypothetical protein
MSTSIAQHFQANAKVLGDAALAADVDSTRVRETPTVASEHSYFAIALKLPASATKSWQRSSKESMLNLHASLMARGRLAVDSCSASRNRPQLIEMSSTSYFLASSSSDVTLLHRTWLFVSYIASISRRTLAAVSSSCSLVEDGTSDSRPLHW